VDDLFAPPSGNWNRVSPKLATARRLGHLLWAVPLLVAALVLLVVLPDDWWIGALVGVLTVIAYAWTWVWAARNQRSWGYVEDEDDLVVTGGVMFRRLVAIPYGRMQFVDVQAGPIDRAFGIATVTLHTASTETAADIPGLPAAEATRLRNRLTELGEAHGAGL
jgi:membrane protein YdbS with pleckstrin-like domain